MKQYINVDDFITELRKYLGVKFLDMGRTEAGLDCVGLPIVAAKNLGFYFYDVKVYSKRPDQKLIIKSIEEAGLYQVRRNEIDKGDLLLMSYEGNVQHIAIVSEKKDGLIYIIHAVTGREVIEHRLDDNWLSKVVMCYRFNKG